MVISDKLMKTASLTKVMFPIHLSGMEKMKSDREINRRGMIKDVFFILLSFTLLLGGEYKFNQIGAVPHGPAHGAPFLIGDTDSDGLNEIIFHTYSFNPHQRRTPPWEIWEYRPGVISYEREYIAPSEERFYPYAVGDIDKDGLSDIIGRAAYGRYGGDSLKIIMLESSDPFSHPTEVVWGVGYGLGPGEDTNSFWEARPLIADINSDGRNEYIIPYYETIFVAKCTDNNKIEFIDSTQLKEEEWLYDYNYILEDFDRDGKIGIVFGGGWNTVLKIYENTEGYKFENVFRDSIPPLKGGDIFSSKDSDGDGKPEIFLSCGGYEKVRYLYRWETIGDDSYSRIFIDSAEAKGSVARSDCGDLDGDGIDEVVWSLGRDIYLYKSAGNDRYERVWHWISPFSGGFYNTQVKVYDMNKNGYGEIIIHAYATLDTILIFEIDPTLGIVSTLPIFQSSNLLIFPNPFKTVTSVKWQVPSEGPIGLRVYDATGSLIRTLAKAQNLKPAAYTIIWRGEDERGMPLPNGVYFVRLERDGSASLVRKVILQR